ncbi:MAG TPA: SDR family NAD(P)-dependent oxidoreductase [Chthoniobacterales bacterium]|nr:SDR family NAD(P)-dependent oxidoreductase [Chthoniobacterales bacterium]
MSNTHNPGLLEGKVAVITGGATGIGLATAKKFVAEGAHVFIFGRRKAELNAAVEAIDQHITAVQGDVTKPSDLDRLYSAVKAEKGKLDVVFANAAVAATATLEQVTEEHFDRHFDINVKGTVFTLQKALPCLAKVLLSSLMPRLRASRDRQGSVSTPQQKRPYAISSGPGFLSSRGVAFESMPLARVPP